MDDVSKLQKINNLARELMSHGQASSMEEATRIAVQQIEGEGMAAGSGEVAAEAPAVEGMPEAPAPAEGVPEVPAAEGASDAPVVEQLEEVSENVDMPRPEDVSSEDLMHRFQDVVSSQQSAVSRMTNVINAQGKRMDDLNNKVNSLIAEIASLKDELRKVKENPVVAPPLKPKAAKEGQTQFKESQPAPTPEQKHPDASGHARSGNYKPEDVAVDKVFYYGNR
ncbi:hypothetical protein ACFL3V_06960 [Nanoarchaeota archaeon]